MLDPDNNYPELKRKVTRAILKFCEDHNYPDAGLSEVRNCLRLLKQGDIADALNVYHRIPVGGRMGYFDDWIPEPVFPNENEDYLQVVFIALINEWDRVMKLGEYTHASSP